MYGCNVCTHPGQRIRSGARVYGERLARGELVRGDRETVHGFSVLDHEVVILVTSTRIESHPKYDYSVEPGSFISWNWKPVMGNVVNAAFLDYVVSRGWLDL